MSVILAPHARTTTRDDRPVLATAPLKPGFDRADLCRYDHPSWDLGPAVFRENARRWVQKSEQTGTGFRLKAAGDFGRSGT